jgi:hypothetical protein
MRTWACDISVARLRYGWVPFGEGGRVRQARGAVGKIESAFGAARPESYGGRGGEA